MNLNEKTADLLATIDRAIYHALDRLGLSSPTERLNQYFEQLAKDGTIELEEVEPTVAQD